MDEKVREARLRPIVEGRGYFLEKSRTRDPDALEFGLYRARNPKIGGCVNPALVGRFSFSWSLDDVEAWLEASP